MRISGLTINLQSLNIIHNTSNRYNNLLIQASSGLKIQKGHEDPILAQKSIAIANNIRLNEQYKRNINDANSVLNYTENIFNEASDIIIRVKELALQGATGTIPDDSREALVQELNQIIIELANMGNQKYNGKYIFAGTNTTTRPFEITGEPPVSVTYNGNTEEIKYNILDNYKITTNVSGDKSFEVLINTVIDIRDNIRDNNIQDLTNNGLVKIDNSADLILNIRTELGSKSKIMENTLERVMDMSIELEKAYTELIGVDLAQNSIEQAGVALSYQASLSIVGKLHEMSLLKYMR